MRLQGLAQWYRSEGKDGRPFEGQALIELAFILHKTVDELETADEYWINRMLISKQARGLAAKTK